MHWLEFILSTLISSGLIGIIGKFWIEKIIARDLEKIKAELSSKTHRKLASFNERLITYRSVIDMFGEFLFSMQLHFNSEKKIPINSEEIIRFEKLRMQTYSYLALLASQEVMDAHEALVECIWDILEGKQEFNWSTIRNNALNLLNAAREDLGIDKEKIVYNGTR